MFDVGFWELAFIALIGLIVLGPDRLPVVARTIGRWVGRARRQVRTFTADLEREADIGDLKRDFDAARNQFKDHGQRVESEMGQFRDEMNQSATSSQGPGGGRDHFRRARTAKSRSQSQASADSSKDDDTPQ